MQVIKNEKAKKTIFFIIVVISFAAILIYNFFTPLMSDDLLFYTLEYDGIGDVFREGYDMYMHTNGRFVLHTILRLFSLVPKNIFNIFNSLCFILLMLLIYWNAVGLKKYDSMMYIMINLFAWNFSVEFDQTVLWMSGACNYLWGTTIILGIVTYYRFFLESDRTIKHPLVQSIGLLIWGVLAGWCNENTSGGCILLTLSLSVMYFVKNKRILPQTICVITGLFTGFLFMIFAPGNMVRRSYISESHSGIMKYVARFLKINGRVNQYMLLYIAVIILLLVYYIYKYKQDSYKDFIYIILFSVAGLATCYALILAPEPMPRAYFGANIFFLTAAVETVNKIRKEDEFLYSLKMGAILVGTIWMYFSYMENGANLARLLREVNNREAYILEQKEKGNYDLTLPIIREEFKCKYSFLKDVDIEPVEDSFNNACYRIGYNLNSIKAVPEEEWKP